jgi:polyhydroxybutyrate depolymerase
VPKPVFLTVLAVCALTVVALGAMPSQRALAAQTAGCGPARPHASGSSSASITTADGERTYLLHVPASYNGADAVPLVLGFHGMTGNSAGKEAYSQFSATADQPDGGFIVAYPQGLATTGVTHFNNTELPGPEPDDVAFVSALLDDLESQLCIDANRVYAAGFSNGAQMSTRLACSLSSRIAAVGLVAGAYYPPEWKGTSETCPDTRPVPPSAAEMKPALSIPCARRRLKRVLAAYASSRCSGCLSPVTSAKATMSCSETVFVNSAVRPTRTPRTSTLDTFALASP